MQITGINVKVMASPEEIKEFQEKGTAAHFKTEPFFEFVGNIGVSEVMIDKGKLATDNEIAGKLGRQLIDQLHEFVKAQEQPPVKYTS